ncbi:glycosyltransferase [Acinetobacter radioresistens]|jgi:GalNAc-alpha-(1->4)-GalNAc-alpha-(1->3)-diNAcBac-PP-undecaprenol alpha-1,4-N-acetyl-D-galactosaminyltransferase|uniref:glycosyltransferase n=1 Tax=Acinetobacter radioresistens TaxID=40216 RepID=UPI00300AE2E8
MIIPSLGSGGAERVLSGLANDWIARKSCTIEIVVLMKSDDFYEINKNIKIHRLNYNANNSSKIFSLIKLIVKLRALIQSVKPDICFSFIRQSNIITLLASRGIKCKVVISERDSPETPISSFYNYLRKKLYPLCDGLIVQTQFYKEFVLNNIGNINQQVIPNPVRDIFTENIIRENIIICVGRLIPIKGHKYLIEAFSKCINKDGWELVILGDGILRKQLLRQAEELGIQNQVKLMGATRQVDQWLAKSSIFAFTSLSEGFPNALAEGMSASLPCVSFNCITGPQDLIENEKNGFLVEVGDIDNFSKNLDILIQSKELRQKIGIRAKSVANNLNFIKISERYFSFLIEILSSTK